MICSYDKKPLELKEMCKTLRRNAIKTLSQEKSKTQKENEPINQINEEFPDSAYDLLKKLLEIDCNKRVSAEEALKHEFFHD